jgi:hypothetical protein
MKWLFTGILATMLLKTCLDRDSTKTDQPVSIVSKQPGLSDSIPAISFEKDIVPILKSRCSPCHFPGGKMYERMPFDKAKTLTDHHEGILRRIKDPAETDKLKTFLGTIP